MPDPLEIERLRGRLSGRVQTRRPDATGAALPSPAQPSGRATKSRTVFAGVAIGGIVLAIAGWQIFAQSAFNQSSGKRPAGSGATTGGASSDGGSSTNAACNISHASLSATSTAPDGIDGAGQTISYSAYNMTDGDPGTAWRTPGRGIGDAITVEFPKTCRLSSVRLLNGYHKRDPIDGTDRWKQNRRLQKVEIEFSSRTAQARLSSGSRSWQIIRVEEPAVSQFTLRILGTAPSKPARDFTAISEIDVS